MLVGLTGGFGTGKSTVLGIFKGFGAVAVDADRLVHKALESDDVRNELVSIFGSEILREEGIDRKRLAELVFSSHADRKRLEAIIHPIVYRRIHEVARRFRDRVVIAEIPLLFETGRDKEMDAVITVVARPEKVTERLIRKGYSEEEIKRRQAAQMPVGLKGRKSHFVIDNSDGMEATGNQAAKVWNQLLSLITLKKDPGT